MYFVEVSNPCSCTIKRAIPEKQSFDTKEEANMIFERMNNEFCQKHSFELKNEFGNFTIYVRLNR